MNIPYMFSYKRRLFWNFFSLTKKYKVIGHSLDKDSNKMVLYFEDGSLKEITKWNDCEIHLKIDWVLAMKKKMESETGSNISLNV